MLKFIHLNYHCHTEFTDPLQVIEKHKLSSGFINFIKNHVQFISIKHSNYQGRQIIKDVPYHFFKSKNKFWYIPFKTLRFIKAEAPDIVLVEGFVFPLQVIFLRAIIGKKAIIITQHQGEKPFKGIKKIFQKFSGRCINAFAFASIGNADVWLSSKIIDTKNKCFEVVSASTTFKGKNKLQSKAELHLNGKQIFLWVGRLNTNKDPLTILKAFNNYLQNHSEARLYMIYQTEDLLPQVKAYIEKKELLQNKVLLIGEKKHAELETWYSAADYFISGSHFEGGGYALVEAMTCGCIPIITDIPSFRHFTNNGDLGFLYTAGNADELLYKLTSLPTEYPQQLSNSIKEYAAKNLSHKTIADQIIELCQTLLSK